jgi:hypothetical protein
MDCIAFNERILVMFFLDHNLIIPISIIFNWSKIILLWIFLKNRTTNNP